MEAAVAATESSIASLTNDSDEESEGDKNPQVGKERAIVRAIRESPPSKQDGRNVSFNTL